MKKIKDLISFLQTNINPEADLCIVYDGNIEGLNIFLHGNTVCFSNKDTLPDTYSDATVLWSNEEDL